MPTDLKLLEEYTTDGDVEALGRVVAKHWRDVHAVCERVLRNPHDAEDVAQDCFALLALHPQAPQRSVRAWLCRLAQSRAFNLIRTTQRRKEREEAACELASDADHEVDREHLLALLNQEIAKLPAKEQELLLRHYSGNLSQAALASELGVSQASVSRKLSRARRTLKKRMEQIGACLLLLLVVMPQRAVAAFSGVWSRPIRRCLGDGLRMHRVASAGKRVGRSSSALARGVVAGLAVLTFTMGVAWVLHDARSTLGSTAHTAFSAAPSLQEQQPTLSLDVRAQDVNAAGIEPAARAAEAWQEGRSSGGESLRSAAPAGRLPADGTTSPVIAGGVPREAPSVDDDPCRYCAADPMFVQIDQRRMPPVVSVELSPLRKWAGLLATPPI